MQAKQKFSEKSGKLWLCIGLLMPPVVWAAQLEIVYLLTEFSCKTSNFFTIHIASIISLALALAGTFISWRHWIETGGEWKSEKAGVVPRSRFMAILGTLLGALFSLLIFAQWLPTALGVPCYK